ncbi:MAG: nucleoid occlusion factor SlmA, partial [Burkholderiales bacterium PBB4]
MPDAKTEEIASPDDQVPGATAGAPGVTRKRPKPGERKVQILQALASMLQQPGGERITTALLAARLEVSEAALYRHFASKAQMFEGLIEFIEQSVFSLINQITAAEPQGDTAAMGTRQAAQIVTMLMQFAEKNPGMSRVMVGDALVLENERLQQRMNLFFDKVEAALKQCLRASPAAEGSLVASIALAFVVGRLQRFVRSGFRRLPTDHLELSLAR